MRQLFLFSVKVDAAVALVIAWWAMTPLTLWIVRQVCGLTVRELLHRVWLSYVIPIGAAVALFDFHTPPKAPPM